MSINVQNKITIKLFVAFWAGHPGKSVVTPSGNLQVKDKRGQAPNGAGLADVV